jgi:hypothetical protein
LRLPFKAASQTAEELRARAEQIRAAAAAAPTETGLGSWAQQSSDDQASRYRQGDLGFLTSVELEKRLGSAPAKALLALQEPGEVSEVIEVPAGFYVVRLIGRQPGTKRPIAEVKSGIVYLLQQTKQAEWKKQFSAGCTNDLVIQINQSVLEADPPAAEPDVAPSLPTASTASMN